MALAPCEYYGAWFDVWDQLTAELKPADLCVRMEGNTAIVTRIWDGRECRIELNDDIRFCDEHIALLCVVF